MKYPLAGFFLGAALATSPATASANALPEVHVGSKPGRAAIVPEVHYSSDNSDKDLRDDGMEPPAYTENESPSN